MKQKIVLLFLSFFLFSLYQLYAQAPTITGISSYTGVPGKQVTIYGTNFSDTLNNNTVWFDKVKGTVTASTSTQLTVTIPFGAMNGPIDVNTRGLYAKSGFDFVPTFKGNHAGFTSASKFSAGMSHLRRVNSTSSSIGYLNVVGDLDGDGRIDGILYTVSSISPDSIPLIYRNQNSPGRIDSFVLVGTIGNSRADAISMLDVDGDNRLDLLLQRNDSIFVHKNSSIPGVIYFDPAVFVYKHIVTQLGFFGNETSQRDIDGDGKIDILMRSKLLTPNPKIYILKNNSSLSAISSSTFTLLELGSYPRTNDYFTGFCDIDYNGFPDLLIANIGSGSTTNDTIHFWIHNAVAGVIDSNTYANRFIVLSWPNTNTLRPLFNDLDLDGKQDIMWSYFNGSNINSIVQKNNHVSGLASPTSIGTYLPIGLLSTNSSGEIADVSGDGFPEIITGRYSGTGASGTYIHKNGATFGNIPNNIFASFFIISNDSSSGNFKPADFDNDGRIDYLMSRGSNPSANVYSSTVSIRRNQLEFLPPTITGTVSAVSQTNTSATLAITKGDGMGRAILIGANYSFSPSDTLNSNGNYIANTLYGAGTQVHSGLYLLHLGDADTITVTGLSPNTNYTIMVIEYNSIVNPRAYFNFMPSLAYLSTLPVKLVSFTAEKKGEDVLLNWKTASEENNARFDIERKTPQGEWEVVGSVKGNGTTHIPQYYHHIDNEAFTETGSHTLFYRLNQIDYDGSAHHSPVVTVNKPLLSASINIQPNPNEGLFEVVFPSNTISGTIRVTNLLGTTLYEQPIEGNTQTLDLSNNKGLLMVQIISGNEVITKKVLVR